MERRFSSAGLRAGPLRSEPADGIRLSIFHAAGCISHPHLPKAIYLIHKWMYRDKTPDKRRRRDVSTTDRGACNASGAVGPPCCPLQVEASRGACAASKRDSAGLAQPRLSPARNCAPSGACCEIVDDELSNSSDCYAISAVGCRHIARSAGLTACVFMSFCLKKPEKTPGPVHTAPGADQCSLYANMLD